MKYLSLILVLIALFTGCTSKNNKTLSKETTLEVKPKPKPLTWDITQEEISEDLKEKFPLKKDFLIGEYTLSQPKIKLKEKDQRIHATIELKLVTLLTGAHKGTFSLSGKSFFNKQQRSIYLQDVKIEQLIFNEKNIPNQFPKAVTKNVQPLINKLFKQYPIYTIPEDSFLGSFVKDIKVGNEKLIVTFGL